MGDTTRITRENRLETTARVTKSTVRMNWTALIKKWEWGIDPKDATIKDIREYLTTKDLFQEDFKNFTVDTFKVITQKEIQSLRNCLRCGGVRVMHNTKSITIAQTLVDVIQEEEQHPWSEEDLQHASQDLQKGPITSVVITLPTATHLTDAQINLKVPSSMYASRESSTFLTPVTSQNDHQQFYGLQQDHSSYRKPSPSPSPSTRPVYMKQVSDIVKMYTEDQKYNGATSSFEYKLMIFKSYCEQVELPEEFYIKAFPTMLTSLQPAYRTTNILYEKLITACQGSPVCRYAISDPSGDLGQLINKLHSSIMSYEKEKEQEHNGETYFTDCRYHTNRGTSQRFNPRGLRRTTLYSQTQGRCFICKREGCRLWKHPQEEQDAEKAHFKARNIGKFSSSVCGSEQRFNEQFKQYVADCEGSDSEEDELGPTFETLFAHNDVETGPEELDQPETTFFTTTTFFTSCGSFPVELATPITTELANNTFLHQLTTEVPTTENYPWEPDPKTFTATTTEVYSVKSLARYDSRQFHGILIDTGAAKHSTAGYGQFEALQRVDQTIALNTTTKGMVTVQFGIGSTTSIGSILVNTPIEQIEFHVRLHRRFGHPSVARLQRILDCAGHDIDKDTLKYLTKFCAHCQRHGKSPGRFRFNLQDDVNFNYSIIINVFYIDGKPVLHIVDEGTCYQAGPPDQIVTDAGKNFVMEAHNSIGHVERYHALVRHAYQIIAIEIHNLDKDMALQMAFKAVNDSVGPNGLVPTLLVYGAYPCMSELDTPAPTVSQRAMAIKKAMEEISKIRAKRQVQDTINIRNGPDSTIAVAPPPVLPVKRRHGRPRKYPEITAFLQDEEPEPQFAASRQAEISGLLEKGVFEIADPQSVPNDIHIFNARFVDKIKNKGTEKAFEKSCLVVYMQSTTLLNQDFYVRPPPELTKQLGLREGSILQVVKPLYRVPEAGNHWFQTYHSHHVKALTMKPSTYDPCLLYSTEPFGVVRLQTDDTLFVGDAQFAELEQEQLKKANFLAKEHETLTTGKGIKFNGGIIQLNDTGISLTQERQYANLQLVTGKSATTTSSRGTVRQNLTTKEQYIAQRARGAYIASVCQPEASYDLLVAAQAIDLSQEDVKSLNKRLQWQIQNTARGIQFVKLEKETLQLLVFTDASFANNRDLSSQIGYIVALADRKGNANTLHWTSVKCKRVTRSVLASELYGMAHGFDMGAAIKSTIEGILEIDLPLVICTDSRSLYDCLVKLGTTQEKRLMIDVMCLRQAYERRQIAEVRWIEGTTNPADSMTKGKPSSALKQLL
ncbi:hypothetical protein B7463_g12573, partial [Scytalidium lignicola]